MCGIVVALTPGAPTRAGTLAAMARAMRHRGPDDEGHLLFDGRDTLLLGGADTPEAVWSTPTESTPRERLEAAPRAGTLAMGHRRLAIIDLSPQGHQPMRRGDRYVVYNGEIYNHVELRAELAALGHAFHSGSDTEVLLAALQQWGPAALSRCNGMWAFAVFDAARRTLFVARDRFGVKPLYVWRRGDALLLASEIKALLAHPMVRAAPEAARCADYLRHGPRAWDEATEFAGITRFPAGAWAEVPIDAPSRFEPRAWWRTPQADPALEAHAFDAAQARRHVARYAELLHDAVQLRLRADVRVGTALSGGLDSSSIALAVNDELRRRGTQGKQEVFSSVYRDPALGAYDESAFIERVASTLDVRSNRIEPAVADVPAAHEHMIRALEEPPAGTLMSSWHTFRLVRERGVTVTLDGQGADEQLAGYARYTRNRIVHAGFGAAIGEARAIATSMQGFGSHVAIGLAGQLARRVAGRARLAAAVRSLGMGSNPSATLGEALAHDFEHNLRNLLLYADKTSMAWSVESRMPFMDYRLVEWLATVPPAYKIHEGWTKWLAREAFATRLPAEVAWRRDKMGWPVPEPVWFGGPLAGWLDATLAQSEFVRSLGVAPDASLAARIRRLNLAVWHRVFFEPA